MLANNAGFNCTTSRVIVTAAGWPQREALLDRVRRRLGQLPTRLAYHPGAAARFAAFGEVHPEAQPFGDPSAGHLPWMLHSRASRRMPRRTRATAWRPSAA